MKNLNTLWMGLAWWGYVFSERYILEHTPEFHTVSSGASSFNGLGILSHFIMVFFVSGCFTMIRFRRRVPQLKDVILFSIVICLVSSMMDLWLAGFVLSASEFGQVFQWYVLVGYLLCMSSCVLFSRDFSLSFGAPAREITA